MNIAICDNDQKDIEHLKKLILECEICPKEIVFLEFLSGEKLIENYTKYDLIFLDISLGGISGTETAEQIRVRDSDVPIVFYTDFDLLASKFVKMRPLHYLIKGSSIEEHNAIIHSVLQDVCKDEKMPDLTVTYGGKTFVLSLSDILYISIFDKGTAIWLRDERRKEIFGELKKNQNQLEHTIRSGIKLEQYYEQLNKYGFIYAKKSYIVNARFIIGRLKDYVTLKGGYELSVARSKKKQFDDQLTEYWVKNTISG